MKNKLMTVLATAAILTSASAGVFATEVDPEVADKAITEMLEKEDKVEPKVTEDDINKAVAESEKGVETWTVKDKDKDGNTIVVTVPVGETYTTRDGVKVENPVAPKEDKAAEAKPEAGKEEAKPEAKEVPKTETKRALKALPKTSAVK